MQWLVVNYTLPRNEGSSQPKGWIQGNTKIGPVLEVKTISLHGKHGLEIRIMSLSGDDTHSWVRISHGSNKFVMDLNNNDTEIPEDQPKEQALQLNVKDFACRSKAKAKPQKRELAGDLPSIIPINERNWIDIEPENYSLSTYEVSKKVIHLLRDSQQVHREEDGTVQFWRIIENLQSQFPQFLIGLTIVVKHVWQQEEEQKRDISTALMIQEQSFVSELYKDIQDPILLILHCRTMWLFRADFSITFTM